MYRRFDEYDRSGITGPVEDPPGGGDPLPARILGQKWLDITWAWDPSASLAQLITGFEVGVAVGTAPGQDPWLVAPFTVPASDRRAVRAVSLASDLTTAHACVRPLYGAQAGPWTVQGVAQSVAAVPLPVATLVQVQAAQAAANNAATAAANAQTSANAASAAASYADRLARSGNNLIKNGNSEDPNPTGYEAAGVVNDPTNSYAGSCCRKMVAAGSYANTVVGAWPCNPGEQFFASARCKAPAGGSIGFQLRFLDVSGANIAGSGVYSPGTSSTTYVLDQTNSSTPPTAPLGAVTTVMELVVFGGSGPAYWDCLYACRKVSAPMLEADILKALLVLGEVIQSPNYTPGAAGVAPGGFKLAGQTFTVTYLDGSTGSANLELGEGASIAGHPALSYANLLRWRKVEFSTPGAWSWTVPAGVRRVRLAIVGGGRGGQGGQGGTPSTPGAGGGGGYPGGAIVVDLDVTPGQVLSGVIGAGGPRGPAGYSGSMGTTGTAGGNTTLVAAGRTWTALGGGSSPGGATGGFGSSKASGTASRVYDPLDGLLCAGDGATARFSTGASGAKNVAASSSTGGAPSYAAAGAPGGPGATANALDGSAGLAGSRGSGGGGGGGGGGYSTSTYGGVGGAGGDGYVVIEY